MSQPLVMLCNPVKCHPVTTCCFSSDFTTTSMGWANRILSSGISLHCTDRPPVTMETKVYKPAVWLSIFPRAVVVSKNAAYSQHFFSSSVSGRVFSQCGATFKKCSVCTLVHVNCVMSKLIQGTDGQRQVLNVKVVTMTCERGSAPHEPFFPLRRVQMYTHLWCLHERYSGSIWPPDSIHNPQEIITLPLSNSGSAQKCCYENHAGCRKSIPSARIPSRKVISHSSKFSFGLK